MKTNNTVRKAASGRRAAIPPRKQKEPRNLLFSFAVVALGLVLAVLVIFFFTRLNRTFYSYTSSANDILRQLNRGDYAEAWYEKQMNEGNGVTADKKEDYVVPYAVVDYFEAASYRTAYEITSAILLLSFHHGADLRRRADGRARIHDGGDRRHFRGLIPAGNPEGRFVTDRK